MTRNDLAPTIAGREASIAYAVATQPAYADDEADLLGILSFNAPLVRTVVAAALTCASMGTPMATNPRDLALLRSCIPQPAPSFVGTYNAQGFAAALSVQQEQERARRLRSLS